MKPHKFNFTYHIYCPTTNQIYFGVHSTNDLNDGYPGSSKIMNAHTCMGSHNVAADWPHQFFDTAAEAYEAEKTLIAEGKRQFGSQCVNQHPGGKGGWDLINELGLQPKAGHPSFPKVIDAIVRGNRSGKHREQNIKNLGTGTAGKTFTKTPGSADGERNSQYGSSWWHNPNTGENRKVRSGQEAALLKMSDPAWRPGRRMERTLQDVLSDLLKPNK